MATSGRFKGIKETKVFKTGQFFKEGKFRVKIKAVKWIVSAVDKDEYFIIETEVLESNNIEIKVGDERSHVINMGNVMGLPNVKGFVAAVSGVDPAATEINDLVQAYWSKQLGEYIDFEQVCELICSDTNPLKDEEMELTCFMTKTREGNDFTKHVWEPRDVTEENGETAETPPAAN